MAMEVAAITKRMTGDRTNVVTHYTDKNHVCWKVFRTDPAGIEYQV
jgi:hypothetical protein